MSSYRVKIDLSNFFNDYRDKSYVLIRKEWKCVECLQKHVENLFDLNNINFMLEDIFLPPKENINVICSGDTIKAINQEAREAPVKDLLLKKKRKKSKTNDTEKIITPEETELSDIDTSINKDSSHNLGIIKPKRKRKRPKKNSNLLNSTILDESTNVIKKENNSAFKKISKHIRFDENNDPIEKQKSCDIQTKPHIQFVDSIEQLDKKKPRLIKAIEYLSTNASNYKGNFMQDQEDKISVSSVNVELTPSNVANADTFSIGNKKDGLSNGIHLKDKQFNPSSNQCNNDEAIIEKLNDESSSGAKSNKEIDENKNDSLSTKFITVESLLSKSQPFVTIPAVGDLILFKLLRLNAHNEPTLSEYICGKLEDVYDEVLNIFIIDGHEETKDLDGKHSLAERNESDDYLLLTLEEMFDKKVFPM